jgi:hypothetical protein
LFLTFSSGGRDYNHEGREEKIKREDGKLMQAYNRMQTFIKIDDDMKVGETGAMWDMGLHWTSQF